MNDIKPWAYLDLYSLTDQAKSHDEESDTQGGLHAGGFFQENDLFWYVFQLLSQQSLPFSSSCLRL